MAAQFEDLQSCYLQLRRCGRPPPADGCTPSGSAATVGAGAAAVAAATSRDGATAVSEGVNSAVDAPAEGACGMGAAAAAVAAVGGTGPVGPVLASGGLAEFSRMLSVFTHCSKLRVRAMPAMPMSKWWSRSCNRLQGRQHRHSAPSGRQGLAGGS